MYLTLKRSTTQGSFFKNNSPTSFHPLLLKAPLFSEIASPSSVPPALLLLVRLPLYSGSHVLLFICWFCFSLFFPLCKKKAENRMSDRKYKEESKSTHFCTGSSKKHTDTYVSNWEINVDIRKILESG